MAVLKNILQSYRAPGAVVKRQRDAGVGEERLLAYLMIASILTFAARVPELRQLHGGMAEPKPEFTTFAAGNILASVIFAPLFMYMIAAISHLIARAFGARGNWYDARLALFWSLLALQPLVLLRGLVVYPVADAGLLSVLSIATGAVFLTIWLAGLYELEFGNP